MDTQEGNREGRKVGRGGEHAELVVVVGGRCVGTKMAGCEKWITHDTAEQVGERGMGEEKKKCLDR